MSIKVKHFYTLLINKSSKQHLYNLFLMKNSLKPIFYFALLVFISISCTVYLQSQDFFYHEQFSVVEIAESYVPENANLPDVKFIKEVLKTIFNIIKL